MLLDASVAEISDAPNVYSACRADNRPIQSVVVEITDMLKIVHSLPSSASLWEVMQVCRNLTF